MKYDLARGQTSIEFLYAVGMMHLVFETSAALFYQSQPDASAATAYTDSQIVCQAAAGRISAVASAGDGAALAVQLPLIEGGSDYKVFVSGPNRTVSVMYAGGGSGCRFVTSNVSNGSSSSFFMANNTVMWYVKGGVLVG